MFRHSPRRGDSVRSEVTSEGEVGEFRSNFLPRLITTSRGSRDVV